MLEAMFTGPLRDAADHVDRAPSHGPAFVLDLDDRSDRTHSNHAPFALRDLGDFRDLAIDERRDAAGTNGVADIVNVAAERRLHVVDVFGRAEQVEIQTRAAFTKQIDGVSFVEIQPPSSKLR